MTQKHPPSVFSLRSLVETATWCLTLREWAHRFSNPHILEHGKGQRYCLMAFLTYREQYLLKQRILLVKHSGCQLPWGTCLHIDFNSVKCLLKQDLFRYCFWVFPLYARRGDDGGIAPVNLHGLRAGELNSPLFFSTVFCRGRNWEPGKSWIWYLRFSLWLIRIQRGPRRLFSNILGFLTRRCL